MGDNIESVVLGGGCFWCIEAVFDLLPGVVSATSGYAGGATADPTYQAVCGGDTGHAEVVKVEYDADQVSLEDVLDVFFTGHDPTTPNRQGADAGTQYRSIVLYDSGEQKARVESYLAGIADKYVGPVVTELEPLERFYPAEEYHQKYFEKNPHQGYCRVVISPKVSKVREKLEGGRESPEE